MPLAPNKPFQRNASSPKADPPDPLEALEALCREVLAYAVRAKVQQFRYCRRPHPASSHQQTLGEAVAALRLETRDAQALPVCQPLAVELLTKLAALGHQPPCENGHLQKAAARTVNTALLELR